MEEKQKIQWLSEKEFSINGIVYALVENYREAFQEEVFATRFVDWLASYDYIIGDWGFEQLRLRGFYGEQAKKAPLEWKISSLEDYLYEYCNFGCPYFVVERISGEPATYKKRKEGKKTNKKKKRVLVRNKKMRKERE